MGLAVWLLIVLRESHGKNFLWFTGAWYTALNKLLKLVECVFGLLHHESYSPSCLCGRVCRRVCA